MPEVPPPSTEVPPRWGSLQAGGDACSRESLDSSPAGVRARVRRRLERPHSLADGPGRPYPFDLLLSRAYSADPFRANGNSAVHNRSMKDLKRSDGSESCSNGALPPADRGPPRRSVSLADFLFRRKLLRPPPNGDALHIIANPMHAHLHDEDLPDLPVTHQV